VRDGYISPVAWALSDDWAATRDLAWHAGVSVREAQRELRAMRQRGEVETYRGARSRMWRRAEAGQ
jgi:DNA-binding transcriptional regulator YhcF (GntR family)